MKCGILLVVGRLGKFCEDSLGGGLFLLLVFELFISPLLDMGSTIFW